MTELSNFLANFLQQGSPIALAAIGCVFAWRAGVFHLGLEGLMLTGAFVSVVVANESGSTVLGIASAAVICLLLSVVFWFVIYVLGADQIIAGLGLSIVGLGLTTYVLEVIYGSSATVFSDQTLLNPVPVGFVKNLSVIVWMTLPLAGIAWVVLRRTRYGFRTALSGDFPFAARSAGINPNRQRLYALLVTGLFCSLAGAELALGGLHAFSPDMVQGRGYLAFTAVVFGAGTPLGAFAAGMFFGAAEAVGVEAQFFTAHVPIPSEAILALPYVLTIVAVVVSARRGKLSVNNTGYAELRD